MYLSPKIKKDDLMSWSYNFLNELNMIFEYKRFCLKARKEGGRNLNP